MIANPLTTWDFNNFYLRWFISIFQADQQRSHVVAKTAAYTVEENVQMVTCNTTSAGFTVTLPSAVGREGREITVKKTSADGNTLTVGTAGGNIDGAATQTTATQYARFTAKSDGTVWWLK